MHNYKNSFIFVPLASLNTTGGINTDSNQMKKLTRAEEQVMQILWDLEEGMVREILKEFPKPRPAYNTVSTVIRVLEKKGFVDHKAFGNTYVYYPLVARDDYARVHLMGFVKEYFNDSFPKMAAFFAREKQMDINEMEKLLKMTREELKNSKSGTNE